MNRSIFLAFVLSIIAHIAVLLTLLIVEDEPSAADTPIINVRLRQAEPRPQIHEHDAGDVAREQPPRPNAPLAVERPAPRPPAPQPRVAEIPSLPAMRRYTSPVADSLAQQPGGPPAPDAPEVPESSNEASAELVSVAAITERLTAERSELIEQPDQPQPVVRTQALSSEQREMLENKLRRWTETFYKMDDSRKHVTWEHKGQRYTAVFDELVPKSDMGIERVLIEVSIEENGNRLSTEMQMQRLAFSSFAQFVDRWDPAVQIHDDEIDGRFHSNSEIYLGYTRDVRPRFHGRVTVASQRINTSNAKGRLRREEIFLGGLETGIRRISIPNNFRLLLDGPTIDEERVRYFSKDARITFHADGTYGWRYLESNLPVQRESIPDGSFYVIGAKKATLYVEGTVRGKVLVFSPERIVIEGNLTYARDPTGNAEADDYLGLVSDKSIEVAEPDVTGPGDLLINAAIYAKRRFAVRSYRTKDEALLFIYGSVTAGSVSATEPRFATRIQFDQRLDEKRPPSFPMTDRYETVSWDAKWRVTEKVRIP